MVKLYIVSSTPTGQGDINGLYVLISEEGEFFAQHFCSSKNWAMDDLILRNWELQEKLDNRFGRNNWEICYLGNDDMTIQKLMELNDQFYKEDENDAEAQESENDIKT